MTNLRAVLWNVLYDTPAGCHFYVRRLSWDTMVELATMPTVRVEFIRPEPTHEEQAS